jgi:hypothetical protein
MVNRGINLVTADRLELNKLMEGDQREARAQYSPKSR